MSGAPQEALRYQPYYCEENVWWLAGDPGFANQARRVVFISNPLRCCRFREQRAAAPGAWLYWDYHVVLAVRPAGGWQIWDQDSRLGMPVPAVEYLRRTFGPPPGERPELAPIFLLVDADAFRRDFASDRSHMRAADGSWLQPPPAWPVLGGGRPSNLMDFVAMRAGVVGEVFTAKALERRWGGDGLG